MKFIYIFIILLFSSPVFADCFSSAAIRYGVPSDILLAIAKVESNLDPFALNIEGRSHLKKGYLYAKKIIDGNLSGSFDVGIMQVNRMWFDKFSYPYIWGLNACWNVHFGAFILGYELKRSKGNIWVAVGNYHSPGRARQIKYIGKVKRAWQNIQD